MLVIFNNVAINIDNVQSFWMADSLDGQAQGFYIKFNDALGHKILDEEITVVPFEKKEDRDKAFQDILFAYAEGKKAFAIQSNQKEGTQ